MRLIVIGGDAAGMSAASQAKRLAPETEVVVLEMTRDLSYGACGLPYKLPDGQDMADLQAVPYENFVNKRNIDVRLGHRVEAIAPDERSVSGTNPDGPFEMTYDRLVIATGARVVRPPISGLDTLWGRGAYPLKTLQDGRDLKVALADQPKSVLIIGGGYIGLEAAEGFVEAGLDVTVVEALPDVLPFLTDDQRRRVYEEAERHGVQIVLGTFVKALQRKGSDGPIRVKTSSKSAGEHVADLVLVSTGVKPNAEIAAEAGLKLGAAGSVAVDDHLLTSADHIYSAGDCADAIHALTGSSIWIPLALRANRAGKLAGANAVGKDLVVPPVMGTAVFKFFDLQIACTGLTVSEAEAAGFDPVSAEITDRTRAHYISGGGKLTVQLIADRQSGRLLGGTMVGSEGAAHRIDTVVACLYAGLTADQLYAMDLAYAPPFGPAWSPLLICASKLLKKVGKLTT